MEVQSYLFEKDKGWTVEKAKEWFEKHHNPAREHVYALLSFAIAEKVMEKLHVTEQALEPMVTGE